jgi:hypothetical protein
MEWLKCITPFRYGQTAGDAWPLGVMRQVVQRGLPALSG